MRSMASRERRPWIPLACLAALAWCAWRPPARASALAQRALAPVRALSELGAPFELALRVARRPDEVAAAEESAQAALSAQRALLGSAKGDALRAELAALALPTRPELLQARHCATAEVLERPRGRPDVLLVRLSSDARGIEAGLPVVHGDVYVGRVSALVDFERGLLEVELVTAAEAFVGARLEGPTAALAADDPVRMTIGGLSAGSRAARRAHPFLAVHNPSARELPIGAPLCVDESLTRDAERAGLANGYALGRLAQDERGTLEVEPLLDYRSGLFNVVVLCPQGGPRTQEAPPQSPLADGRWLRVRPLTRADVDPGRAGLKLAAGARDGVRAGAVVWSRGRLIGRVARVYAWSCDVREVHDAGLELTVVARVASEERPRVLGRIVALGLERERGHALFHWDALGAKPSHAQELTCELFTGAGEAGLPPGIPLGEGLLSFGAETGQSIVRLLPDSASGRHAPLDARDVWLRLPEGAGPTP
jgi:hypothetical protein